LGERHDRLAGLEFGHAAAQLTDRSGYFETGHEGWLGVSGPPGPVTAAEEDVDQADRGVAGVDADLPRPRLRVSQLCWNQDLWSAELADDHRLHGKSCLAVCGCDQLPRRGSGACNRQ
jgi:hypothetical protein